MIDPAGEEGAWIFVSHSHKDLEKVRRVRNALEERGHNPLLFFLKCLGDDSEVDDLIRREIEARTLFILCDSPNAKASKWVQTEIEIIKSLEGKSFVLVDLDDDFDEQLWKIDRMSERATVFLSFARADSEIAQSIASWLREQDYAVLTGEESDAAEEVGPGLSDQARRALERGFFLLLLSPDAVRSRWVRHELELALHEADSFGRRSSVIPVVVRDHNSTLRHLADSPLGGLLRGLNVVKTFKRHDGLVGACAVAPNGSFIVSGGRDGTLRISAPDSGQELRVLSAHWGAVNGCAVDPEGSFIVSGSDDRTIRIWDTDAGRELRTLEGSRGAINACAIFPDGSRVVSASDDRTTRVFDPVSGELLMTLELHRDAINACAVSPDGSFIASASADGTLAIWDPQAGVAIAVLSGHRVPVTSCAVSPDGSFLLSGDRDGTLLTWEASTGRLEAMIPAHDGAVAGCAVSPDGSFIVSAGADRVVKIHDPATLAVAGTVPLFGWAASIALHPWSPLAVVGDARGNLNVITLAGIEYGAIVVTAVDRGDGAAIPCPACVVRSRVEEHWLGQVIECPNPECDLRLRVNPFVLQAAF